MYRYPSRDQVILPARGPPGSRSRARNCQPASGVVPTYVALGDTTTTATDRPSGLAATLSTRNESGAATVRTGAPDESITSRPRLFTATSITPLDPTGIAMIPHSRAL